MIPSNILDKIYRTFYEITPDLVCTLDENGIIIDANKRMLEHFGYSKSYIVGKSCFDFITLEYKKTALDGFKEMVEKGIGPLIELQMIKNKNETFFGLCKGAKIGKETDESHLYLITIHDVSVMHESLEKVKHTEAELEKKYAELKKTYDALVMVENKYQNLYDNSPDLIRTIDLNGIIEIWLKRKDGSTFPTLFSGNTLFDEKGKLMGRTVAFRDISDIYAARERIDQD